MEAPERPPGSAMLSSSPAFGTPVHPFPPAQRPAPPPPPAFKPSIPTILPVLLPPPTLRPLAFRTFTKRHNLTLNSSALQSLATFIGRHCGSEWRDAGTGERVLEETARLWKAENGPVIVEDGPKLKAILRTLESCMCGGRIGLPKSGRNVSRQNSFAFGNDSAVDLTDITTARPSLPSRENSFGISSLQTNDEEDSDETSQHPRAWLKVTSAYDQPRFSYDMDKKHFIQLTAKPSLFPKPSHKTAVFRERYNIIFQRLLRNEAFQAPSFQSNSLSLSRQDSITTQQFYKITPIANLLGRGGSSHLLLGMLVIAPTGTLALNDLTGSIALDLQHAKPLQGEGSAFFCPGMIVLVDGVYEEEWGGAGSSGLGNSGGVGGTIGGRFVGFSVGGPPVEKRNVSLGVSLNAGDATGGFGWTDFLGLGSERAVGSRMRRLEERLIGPESEVVHQDRRKTIIMSEVNLDIPTTLSALRKVLEHYEATEEVPLAFVLIGNFSSKAAMAGAGTGSLEYKEMFNELAAVMSDFPSLLRQSTWTFVPGDNDGWNSAFSAGASTTVPRGAIPDLFTNRIKRAFANAKSDVASTTQHEQDGEAIWTSNPARLSFFGTAHEMVLYRDDIANRFRRSALRIGTATRDDRTTPVAEPQDEDMPMAGSLPGEEDMQMVDSPSPVDDSIAPPAPVDGLDYTTAQAKKLILSLLPQSTLSPFPLSTRPIHWDYHQSLSLYPLPHTLVLADAETPAFAMTFEGCHVMNPGKLVNGGGKRKIVQWIEYDLWTKRGLIKQA